MKNPFKKQLTHDRTIIRVLESNPSDTQEYYVSAKTSYKAVKIMTELRRKKT